MLRRGSIYFHVYCVVIVGAFNGNYIGREIPIEIRNAFEWYVMMMKVSLEGREIVLARAYVCILFMIDWFLCFFFS